MKILLLLCSVLASVPSAAQPLTTVALPDMSVTQRSPRKYSWEDAGTIRGRILFGNTVAVRATTVYSFGGYDTAHLQREMNIFAAGRLQKAPEIVYPGEGFVRNVFFIRDSLLYLGGGMDSGHARYSSLDFWRYNLNSKEWTRLKDLPFYYVDPPFIFEDEGRINALISRLSGPDFEFKSSLFYAYDEASDSWDPLTNVLPGENDAGATAFKIGDEVFAFFQYRGTRHNKICDFYRFSMRTRQWTRLPDFPGYTRHYAFAFSDGRFGYIGCGMAGDGANGRDVHRFDPVTERWERIKDLPAGVRYGVTWLLKGDNYVGFGMGDRPGRAGVWRLRRGR